MTQLSTSHFCIDKIYRKVSKEVDRKHRLLAREMLLALDLDMITWDEFISHSSLDDVLESREQEIEMGRLVQQERAES